MRVRPGDTLWGLAARLLGPRASTAQVQAAWPRWHAANRAVIGPDPDLLYPGQTLHPPAPADPPADGAMPRRAAATAAIAAPTTAAATAAAPTSAVAPATAAATAAEEKP